MGIWLGVAIVAFVLAIVLAIIIQLYWSKRLKTVKNRHVVVTGGSSGIGKSVAIIAARHGANVTIIARDVQKLEAAKNEILHACEDKDAQKVEYVSLDLGASYESVEKAMTDLERTMGPIYMLINCAGTAVAAKIEDTSVDDLSKMLHINFLGTYYCVKAVAQRMKASKEGIIVLTSSQAALLGVFGYSAYCSTKFALRGLAESIAMELRPYNISVTLSLPPDTDTPGYAIEERSKPVETKLISQTATLARPEDVAEKLFRDALAGIFFSTVGMEGFILTTLCAGMSPITSISQLFLEALLMGFLRIIGAFYLFSFQKIIVSCMKTRDRIKKSE